MDLDIYRHLIYTWDEEPMLLDTSLKDNNRENEVVNWRRIKMKGKLVTPINNKGVSERAGYFIAKLETISETT